MQLFCLIHLFTWKHFSYSPDYREMRVTNTNIETDKQNAQTIDPLGLFTIYAFVEYDFQLVLLFTR